MKRFVSLSVPAKIISFTETSDRRFLIELAGTLRFKLKKELSLLQGYRRIEPDWTPFLGDLKNDYHLLNLNKLFATLKQTFLS